MSRPVSLRFKDPDVAERLRHEAAAHGRSTSSLAEELLDEALRIRRHPLIGFREGPAGRRAALVAGPDIWEVVAGVVGGDVPAEQRLERAVELFDLAKPQVEAAIAYYADFRDEIDTEIASNLLAADEAEERWQRQRDVLAG